MNLIKNYLNNVYLYILLIIPILCMSAGVTYTLGKMAGWHPDSPWCFVLLFDFSQIIYLLISCCFIYRKKRIACYTEKDIFWIKVYITVALFIQYNFIMHVFPTHNAWGCSFIFMGVVAFLFDTKLMLIHILGYSFFLIVAHILHWEQLIPDNLGEKMGIIMYQSNVFFITSVVFFFITFLVERFLIQEQEQETENVYLMKKQLEYYQNCDMLDKELRKFRHDIKGHFLGMEYLLEHENYEELSIYFKELNDSFTFQEKMYFSGNLIIDSILNYDIPNRCNSHVNKIVYGRLTDILTISSIDLCTLFSNMLSNAINAANECSLEEQPQLSVRFDHGSKFFSITVINSIPAKNTSSKKEESSYFLDRNHGYGMHKMKDICKKYNGEFNQTYQDNTITTTAYLPL